MHRVRTGWLIRVGDPVSADNWTVCPRCQRQRQAYIASKRTAVAELYGKVPVDEFDDARKELAALEANEPVRSFREDYDLYGVEEGCLTIVYSGGCTTCNLKFDHHSEHPLPV